jgi:hypothetical protein
MKKILSAAIPLLLLVGCTLSSAAAPPDPYYQQTVDDFSAMIQPIRIGQPESYPERFDAMEYFSVLDHLSMEPGYVLDHVWQPYAAAGGTDGHAVLYARPIGQERDLAETEFWDEAYRTWQWQEYWYYYLDHVQVDDTAEGFFQFTVLRVMGNQFYLYGHSEEFDDTVICNQTGLEAVLTMPDEFDQTPPQSVREEAEKLDLEPVIEMGEETVTVQLVVFTKWGGFEQHRYEINRSFPHRIISETVKTLVPYECGIYH